MEAGAGGGEDGGHVLCEARGTVDGLEVGLIVLILRT